MKFKAVASIALAAAVLCTAVLMGCKKSDDSSTTSGGQGFGNGSGVKQADLMGEVTAISGNKITLKLIKIPTMTRPTGSGGGWNGSRPMGSRPSGNWSSGSRPEGGYGGGYGQAASGASGSRRGASRQMEFTGKTETITVPSAAIIYTRTYGANGTQENVLKVSSIKKDDILSIYYAADKKTIKQISVSDLSSSGGFGEAAGGARNGQGAPNAQGTGAPNGQNSQPTANT